MSLATAELPADPAALRAFALACRGKLKAAQTTVQLKALEIEKLRFQITAGEEHLGAGRQPAHPIPFIARSTRDSALSLTKASTLTRAPFGSAISTDTDYSSVQNAVTVYTPVGGIGEVEQIIREKRRNPKHFAL